MQSSAARGTGRGSELTIERQVSKESGQKVHEVHDSDGDVGYMLHSSLGGAVNREQCSGKFQDKAHTHIKHSYTDT